MKLKTKLPTGWKEVALGEICEIKKGNSITKNTITNGNIPVIAGGQQPAYYHNAYNRSGETLTISGSGAYAGFVAYFNIPIFASDCSTIQTKSKDAFIKYIYYFLKGNQNKIYKMQKGIAQPHVYPKDLAVIKIPLPPLLFQKQIVSILEKAEALKQKREEADKLTKEYLQSVFYEMFGDKSELKNLKDVCEIIMGQSPPGNSYNENGEGTPFFQGKSEFTEKYPIVKKWTTQPIKIALPNSVLLSVRAPVGSVNLCNIKCCIGRGLASIVPKKEVSLQYVYSWFKLNEKNISDIGMGSTFKAISSTQLANLQIPIPSLEFQQKFAKIVEKVEKLKEKQQKSKEKINEMFNSLMQKAFRGELRR